MQLSHFYVEGHWVLNKTSHDNVDSKSAACRIDSSEEGVPGNRVLKDLGGSLNKDGDSDTSKMFEKKKKTPKKQTQVCGKDNLNCCIILYRVILNIYIYVYLNRYLTTSSISPQVHMLKLAKYSFWRSNQVETRMSKEPQDGKTESCCMLSNVTM